MKKLLDTLLDLNKKVVIGSQLTFFSLIATALYLAQNDNFTHLFFISIVAASFYYGSLGGVLVGLASSTTIHFTFNAPHHSLLLNLLLYSFVGLHAGFATDLLNYQINKYKEQARQLSLKEKDLNMKTKTLQQVVEIDKKILSGASLSETLAKACESLVTTFKAKFAIIALTEDRNLRIKAVYGLDSDNLAAVNQVIKPGMSKGLLGTIIKNNKAALIKQPSKHYLLENYQPLIRDYSIKWTVANPLFINGKALGAMAVFFDKDADVNGGTLGQANYFAQQISLAIHNNDLVQQVTELALQTMRSLVKAIEMRDPYTAGHSEKVMNYAVAIARKMGLADDEIQMIRYASLLHDIGKLGIDDAIINKQTVLLKEEVEQMRKHSEISAEILKPIKLLEQIQSWVYHHQERFDGQGYPAGLKMDEIPLGARIISMADAYDAMTSDRPYRKARSKKEALEELENLAGTQFDPRIVESFLQIIANKEIGVE